MQTPQKQTCVKMQGRVSHKQLTTSELILRLLEEVCSFVLLVPPIPFGKSSNAFPLENPMGSRFKVL